MIKDNKLNIVISVVLSIILLAAPFQTAIYTQFASAEDEANEDSNGEETVNGEDETEESPNNEDENGDGESGKGNDEPGESDSEGTDGNDDSDESNGSDEGENPENEGSASEDKENDENENPDNNENGTEEEGPEEDGTEEENENEEDEDERDEALNLDDYEIVVDDVYETSKDSMRIQWYTKSADKEFVKTEKTELYIDGDLIESESSSYSNHEVGNLIQDKTYTFSIRSYITEEDYIETSFERTFDWRYHPVILNLYLNDEFDDTGKIIIRGMDESNDDFKLDKWIDFFDERLELPVGQLSVVLYDAYDLSISEKHEITVDRNKDYIANPINLQFDIKTMKEEANPFEYEIEEIEEESFTVSFNDVPKLEELIIIATNERDDEEITVTLGADELAEEKFTFDSLRENITYAIQVIKRFAFGLEEEDYFNLKTLGEDANGPEVDIPDEDLKQALIDTVGLHHRELTEKDLENLTELSVHYNHINTLEGLQYATGLTDLWLSDGYINDLSPLENLTSLTDLSIAYNLITDVSHLQNLTNLNNLNLGSNKINDLSPLANLTNLQNLYLYENDLTDLVGLEGLTNLEYLDLDNNNLLNVDALENLTNLTSLYINENKIQNIDGLKNMNQLEILNAQNNHIRNIDSLAGLTSLEYLDLDNNRIEDISALSNLTNLEGLYLTNNRIKELPDLSGMTNLNRLHLNDNPLIDISGIAGLKNLYHVDLSNTDIADLSPLLELPALESVTLTNANISDQETIQMLENSGVWIEYDSEDEDTDDGGKIDWGEISEAFVNHPEVTFDRTNYTIQLNLSDSESKSTLTPEQLWLLENKDLTLQIKKNELELWIAPGLLRNTDEALVIEIKDKGREGDSYSHVYEVTATQGGTKLKSFTDAVTYHFNIDASAAKNPANLNVFHINRKGEWENIGGTHHNGIVTISTSRLGEFAIYEAKESKSDEILGGKEDPKKKDPKKEEKPKKKNKEKTEVASEATSKGDVKVTVTEGDQGAKADSYYESFGSNKYLPKTATGMFSLIFGGSFLLLSGLSLLIINRMRKRATNK